MENNLEISGQFIDDDPLDGLGLRDDQLGLSPTEEQQLTKNMARFTEESNSSPDTRTHKGLIKMRYAGASS